jgi:4-hydroxy-3-methylbut-2-en-1-yl diphosphate reductase
VILRLSSDEGGLFCIYYRVMKKREIVLADTLGFCFGVRRAIEQVKSCAIKGRTATFGPLIHNKSVLQEFKRKGIATLNRVEEAEPDLQLVIRAHGVPRRVKEELLARRALVIDGTCPRVIRSEKLVERYSSDGWQIVLAGDHSHGEVAAVRSYGRDVHVVNIIEDLDSFVVSKKLFLLSQTTFSRELFNEISLVLQERCLQAGVTFEEKKTICPATEERQRALEKLCRQVDGVVVIGGLNSSNTKRLYEKALAAGLKAWHIETEEGILPEMAECKQLGVSAGASTPDEVIQRVVAALESL